MNSTRRYSIADILNEACRMAFKRLEDVCGGLGEAAAEFLRCTLSGFATLSRWLSSSFKTHRILLFFTRAMRLSRRSHRMQEQALTSGASLTAVESLPKYRRSPEAYSSPSTRAAYDNRYAPEQPTLIRAYIPDDGARITSR
ncbi:hypothetical protein EVG20_g2586 [Dentipellis fragilis]|uniref:Uncharacterized protein n=1 Tax=Dentipellis fragilis TaxID=205917 RepID=A0A4Y9Z8R6_9AGAM|nr:hypothetical protein EVG20_g2586 [Dentipellis fragilis]